MYIYIYMYIHTVYTVCVYIYIYMAERPGRAQRRAEGPGGAKRARNKIHEDKKSVTIT